MDSLLEEAKGSKGRLFALYDVVIKAPNTHYSFSNSMIQYSEDILVEFCFI